MEKYWIYEELIIFGSEFNKPLNDYVDMIKN
jgi:hypothetical protein